MATTSDRMQIPEYVKRELSEVYLLMDHIAGRKDKTLDQALAPPTTGGLPVTLEDLCGVAWPPTDQNRAKTLALVLTAKDRLSRAAYPATGYSVAFTYLSLAQYINAARGSLRQRLLAPFGRRIALDASRLSAAAPAKPSDAGAMSGGSGEDAAGGALPNSSAMVQFAKDAFPGLEFARESPFDKVPRLLSVLLILLAVTCFVSWDLAVGQRLLADYRWLSSNPQALLVDEKAATGACTPEQTREPGKIDPGSPCARSLAGLRVLPLASSWIGRQIGLPWSIHHGAVHAPQEGDGFIPGLRSRTDPRSRDDAELQCFAVASRWPGGDGRRFAQHRDQDRWTRVGAARLGAGMAAGAIGRVPGRHDRLVHQSRSQQRRFCA